MTSAKTVATADAAAQAFRRYLAGDSMGMEDLVSSLSGTLWHVARATGLSSVAAEDVVQTTWAKLLEKSTTIKEPQSVMAWLMITARREAWRVSKKLSRERVVAPVSTSNDDQQVPQSIVIDPEPLPETVVCSSEQNAVLWKHYRSMSDSCQEILRVIAFADKPNYIQLSQRLGIAKGSVGPTRLRCLAKLRKALESDPRWSTL